MTDLYFAQISDIHLSTHGDMFDMLSGHAADFLSEVVAELNRQPNLDFVLITGDLFNEATQAELALFQQAIRTLQKPTYVIPGNHDRREPDSSDGLTLRQFAHYFNPQIHARLAAGDDQLGYWSIPLKPEIQLIGLDSIKADDWGGKIGQAQMAWLKTELEAQADKLVILACHHPLHQLAPIDRHPDWSNFVCDNGAELLTLFDSYPQLKLVLTGHHHLTRADLLGSRLHLACPALAVYPCAYRTMRLSRLLNGQWRIEWQTHPATGADIVAEARRRMEQAWQEAGFTPEFVAAHVGIAAGSDRDRAGQIIL